MKRNLPALSDRHFQVAVIGGGIFGAAVAREAATRGLSVALVEKGDFMSGASGNSYRMVHGGIRYLQHGDIPRVRISSAERRMWLRTAPHLVRPLPIAIPTYGRGTKGRLVLRAGLAAYDLLTRDRNRGIEDPGGQLPASRMLTRGEVLELFPGVEAAGLTGAGVFADAQLQHPQRLGIAILQSAAEAGAVLANHVEARRIRSAGGRVQGVEAVDALTGVSLAIDADVVIVAAGGWSERLLLDAADLDVETRSTFSRDLCLVVDRPAREMGLAVLGATSDPDAILSRSKRHLFVVPWRGRSLVGVWHIPYDGSPDDIPVGESELSAFVAEINAGYPGFGLKREEITHYNTGLVLFGENRPGARDLRYGHRSRLRNHGAAHGIEGLFSLIGVRYTTARTEAETLIDRVSEGRTWRCAPSETAQRPVHGGDFADFSGLVDASRRRWPGVDTETVEAVCRLHGTDAGAILGTDETGAPGASDSADVLENMVRFGVREEMAITLADIIVRRTDLGLFGLPGRAVLERVAAWMADEAGWSGSRTESEIEDVARAYPLTRTRPGEPSGVRSR